MAPVLAVVIAFLGGRVASASCCTAAGAFAATASAKTMRMKVKFLAVQGSGFLLNEAFTWVLTGPLSMARPGGR